VSDGTAGGLAPG